MTRSLDSSLRLGPLKWWGSVDEYPPSLIREMAECSVTSQALDQLHPDRMQHFVWSWSRDQPDGSSPCTSMGTDGRWMSRNCDDELPHACVSDADELMWVVSEVAGVWGNATCPDMYSFGRPEIGYQNTVLGGEAGGRAVWINHLE